MSRKRLVNGKFRALVVLSLSASAIHGGKISRLILYPHLHTLSREPRYLSKDNFVEAIAPADASSTSKIRREQYGVREFLAPDSSVLLQAEITLTPFLPPFTPRSSLPGGRPQQTRQSQLGRVCRL